MSIYLYSPSLPQKTTFLSRSAIFLYAAYSLLFRANDRTLADTEVNEKIDKMLAALAEKGIVLRA